MVGILFKESFGFSPISTAFDRVVQAFELKGSVVEDVSYAIKKEPVTDYDTLDEEVELEMEHGIIECDLVKDKLPDEKEE